MQIQIQTPSASALEDPRASVRSLGVCATNQNVYTATTVMADVMVMVMRMADGVGHCGSYGFQHGINGSVHPLFIVPSYVYMCKALNNQG